jgi:histidyl-tRNA synthetase
MITKLRGMKDILFEDSAKFNYFLEVATEIAKKHNFEYIETPLLEETKLFKRSVGQSSDIVTKEMYQFIDKGDNDVCLRPEGTASVVRSFIENKLDKKGGIYRFFYHGAMFRYERPQKGRLREFHQFGIESFGVDSIYEDCSLILMLSEIFDRLNIGYKIKINSLGCSECMPNYRDELVEYLNSVEEGLCEDCKTRKEINPIRVLDCKNSSCQELLKDSKKLVDSLCNCCDMDFKKLVEVLESNNLKFEIDTNLVRGLDYYNKTAFEFVSDNIGSQNAIAGGGRYDKLVEFLDGKETKAVGFAIGIERILDLIELPEEEKSGYYFGVLDEKYLDEIFRVASQKRKTDRVIIEYSKKSLKNHLKLANRYGVKYCVVVGENEANEGKFWLKDMVNSKEELVEEV